MPRPKQRKSVIVQLVRHSYRRGGTKTGLSRKGINEAFRHGKKIPSGYKLAGRHGDLPRAKSSAKRSLAGYKSVKGKTYKNVRERSNLSYMDSVVDEKQYDALVEKLGEVNFLRKWIDGEISSDIVKPAQEFADAIIRRTLRLGTVLNKKGARNIAVRNVSHAGVVEAVFERLTGKHFDQTLPRNQIARPNEGIHLTFFPNGKIILKYRNKNYDVTKKFNEIIESGYF